MGGAKTNIQIAILKTTLVPGAHRTGRELVTSHMHSIDGKIQHGGLFQTLPLPADTWCCGTEIGDGYAK